MSYSFSTFGFSFYSGHIVSKLIESWASTIFSVDNLETAFTSDLVLHHGMQSFAVVFYTDISTAMILLLE